MGDLVQQLRHYVAPRRDLLAEPADGRSFYSERVLGGATE